MARPAITSKLQFPHLYLEVTAAPCRADRGSKAWKQSAPETAQAWTRAVVAFLGPVIVHGAPPLV